jgi:O-methyltransferase
MSKKIKIYGAGNAFKDFMSILPSSVEVVSVYSIYGDEKNEFGISVVNDINDFVACQANITVICTRDAVGAKENLMENGDSTEEILSYYACGDDHNVKLVQRDTIRINTQLGTNISIPGICNMYLHGGGKVEFDSFDWVRNQSFILAADRINNKKLKGSVAELGVYRGDQSGFLSNIFPDRKLYLFDTFEGFDDRDIQNSDENSISKAGEFSSTSLQLVLDKILNPERVVVKKGFFPETALDVEDDFVFISLDVDLYSPTIAGLEYFYPRLVAGGVIFIHDYNNVRYSGVRDAVTEFLSKYDCLSFEIPDNSGSIAVLK